MTRQAPYTPERVLPEGDELDRRVNDGETYQAIGDQYGVTRQAVHKALKTWKRREAERKVEADARKLGPLDDNAQLSGRVDR